MTLYPRITISPSSPGGSLPPGASTMATSVPGMAVPTVVDIFLTLVSGGQMVAVPATSVSPYGLGDGLDAGQLRRGSGA